MRPQLDDALEHYSSRVIQLNRLVLDISELAVLHVLDFFSVRVENDVVLVAIWISKTLWTNLFDKAFLLPGKCLNFIFDYKGVFHVLNELSPPPALFNFIEDGIFSEESFIVNLAIVGRPLAAVVVENDIILIHQPCQYTSPCRHLIPSKLEKLFAQSLKWRAKPTSNLQLD